MSPRRTIQAGGLRLTTEEGPDGPQLMIDHRQTASLAAVLNAAARGQLPGLDEALTRGDGAATPVERVARQHPGDEFPAERQRWRELTGEDPGEDFYVVGTAYTPGVMIVPRAALQAGLKALLEIRERAATEKRVGHRGWLADLEERAAAIDQLEVADGSEQRARAAVKRRLFWPSWTQSRQPSTRRRIPFSRRTAARRKRAGGCPVRGAGAEQSRLAGRRWTGGLGRLVPAASEDASRLDARGVARPR